MPITMACARNVTCRPLVSTLQVIRDGMPTIAKVLPIVETDSAMLRSFLNQRFSIMEMGSVAPSPYPIPVSADPHRIRA